MDGMIPRPNPVTYHAVCIGDYGAMIDALTFGNRELCALRNEPTIGNNEFGYSWSGARSYSRLFKTQEATVESMCNPDDEIESNGIYYTISGHNGSGSYEPWDENGNPRSSW